MSRTRSSDISGRDSVVEDSRSVSEPRNSAMLKAWADGIGSGSGTSIVVFGEEGEKSIAIMRRSTARTLTILLGRRRLLLLLLPSLLPPISSEDESEIRHPCCRRRRRFRAEMDGRAAANFCSY
mmetsp:Transcript_37121/g.81390  ORF Transcript_37121/g.81390 Transcript_37121/m.81390 type:complete len:124 (+) Transcript_37121:1-372(+)